ncbi:MAG TPA: type II toxin-antitoxin system RelE/ParE family toxin [Bacillota bacterium]|nr:type II toxin-antitoxin system RelE/ParE family toxin [Bacillota bacterium]
MAVYKIFFKRSVEKELAVIPKKELRTVLQRIKALAEDPRPPGCEKLTGTENYRIRQGRYRIVYAIEDRELTVIIYKIAHRKNVYR